ncbi:hypothetical protein [Phenylobacterium sp.]|uniref:hypothetical protein n=1 Tax=Phenylobacterium sp. TaxID=1871053 RepID=UPI0035B23361
MRFVFPHSHAFPGGRVMVEEDGAVGSAGEVEFADGSVVAAAWRRDGNDFDLEVPTYLTARGTEVAARRWRVVQGRDGVWRTRRVA